MTDGASLQDARTLTYNAALQLDYEVIPGLIGRRITRSYADSGPVLGRPTGLTVGTVEDPDADYATTWDYDDDPNTGTGRLSRVIRRWTVGWLVAVF